MNGMDTPDLEVSGDAVAVIDIEGQSNEEVEALTSRIATETESLRAQTVTLDAFVVAVEDSVAAKKEADEEARIAAEKERLEAEIAQKKSAAQPIGYEDLFRAGDTLIGQYFRFEGKIVQTLGGIRDNKRLSHQHHSRPGILQGLLGRHRDAHGVRGDAPEAT